MAILMSLLFITGFLRMKWMGKSTILKAIEQNTQDANITRQQMSGITRSILSPMWQWHELAAYMMLAVLAARLIYMAVKGTRFPNPLGHNLGLKERLHGSVYWVFYMFVVIATITGFYLQWGNGSLKEPMETVHKWAIYWFPVFILLHLGGIWIAELTTQKGITSKMIGGDE